MKLDEETNKEILEFVKGLNREQRANFDEDLEGIERYGYDFRDNYEKIKKQENVAGKKFPGGIKRKVLEEFVENKAFDCDLTEDQKQSSIYKKINGDLKDDAFVEIIFQSDKFSQWYQMVVGKIFNRIAREGYVQGKENLEGELK